MYKFFITQGFGKLKPGRTWPDTDIPVTRLLGDYRFLNSCLKPAQKHWAFCCPTQLQMIMSLQPGLKWYKTWDLSDAYFTMQYENSVPPPPDPANATDEEIENWVASLTKDDPSCMTVLSFNGRLLMSLGGTQGVAPVAIYWNCHITDGLYFMFGQFWEQMYILFVDDIGTGGVNQDHCRVRSELMDNFLTVFGKRVSEKMVDTTDGTEHKFQDHMVLAGIEFREDGVCITADYFEGMKYSLIEHPVKDKSDVQHVLGSIQYGESAVKVSPSDRSALGTHMAALRSPSEDHYADIRRQGGRLQMAQQRHANTGTASSPQMPGPCFRPPTGTGDIL